MKLLKNTLLYGALMLGITGCPGYDDSRTMQAELSERPAPVQIQAEFPMYSRGAISMIYMDVDGDGDLDLLIGAEHPEKAHTGALYVLKN